MDDGDDKELIEFARKQRVRMYGDGDSEASDARVRAYMTSIFKDDPVSFFLAWDMDAVLHDNRKEWVADPKHITALNVNVQFKLHMDNKTVRASGRSSSGKGAASYKRPSDVDILSSADKGVTFYFEAVSSCSRRLRQLAARQHSKARTYIDCVMEVYNFDPSKGLSQEMYSDLMDAKRSEPKSSIQDNQMLGIIKMVMGSILKGERKYSLVIYEMLLGRIGATCAPKHAQVSGRCCPRADERFGAQLRAYFERQFVFVFVAENFFGFRITRFYRLNLRRLRIPTNKSGFAFSMASMSMFSLLFEKGDMSDTEFPSVMQCDTKMRCTFFMHVCVSPLDSV